MTLQSIFGLGGCGLLLIALTATALRLQGRAIRVRTAVVLVAALLAFVPIGDLSLAGYARGAIGDLSITTLALAANACLVRVAGKRLLDERELNALCWLAAGAGLFLYPFALGLTPFDPYALGYGSIALTAVLLLVTLAAWHAGLNLVVLVVLAAAVAYLAGAYESRNLWDYLIDPLAAAYALALLAAAGVRKLVSQRRERAPLV